LCRKVIEQHAALGVAFDGDADRAMFVSASGRVVDGDGVLLIAARYLRSVGQLHGARIIGTTMANLGLERLLAAEGLTLVRMPVGDRYVLEEMLSRGAVLGGEQSGHVIFAEHATTGDGILTAVTFLSIARRKGVSVRELAGVMQRFPQVLENVTVAHRERLSDAGGVWEAVREAETALGEQGRVLVRASGTEPLVRVMVEAASQEEAARYARAIATVVAEDLG
jgi:phosphoglucosamine mutase